jgi:hypothetical protein
VHHLFLRKQHKADEREAARLVLLPVIALAKRIVQACRVSSTAEAEHGVGEWAATGFRINCLTLRYIFNILGRLRQSEVQHLADRQKTALHQPLFGGAYDVTKLPPLHTSVPTKRNDLMISAGKDNDSRERQRCALADYAALNSLITSFAV